MIGVYHSKKAHFLKTLLFLETSRLNELHVLSIFKKKTLRQLYNSNYCNFLSNLSTKWIKYNCVPCI